jgi:ferrous iron transport protein A
MNLAQAPRRHPVHLVRIGGERSFRRRLLELGLVPGTAIEVLAVAPLGDPLELWVRGSRLSIRRAEAEKLEVTLFPRPETRGNEGKDVGQAGAKP